MPADTVGKVSSASESGGDSTNTHILDNHLQSEYKVDDPV
jgi:hypothetical protein